MILQSKDVKYNPKTDEYEIELKLLKLGTLFGVPIYCDEASPHILSQMNNHLGSRPWIK